MRLSEVDLTRLAYSAACRELSDRARGQVPTYADEWGQAGGLVEAAAMMLADADRVLQLAVAAERAASVSWQTIGEVLDVSRQSAHERFAGAVQEVRDGILFPHRDGLPGLPGWWACPDGLDDPERTLCDLDKWVVRHRESTDPGGEREHPVSEGPRPA